MITFDNIENNGFLTYICNDCGSSGITTYVWHCPKCHKVICRDCELTKEGICVCCEKEEIKNYMTK